MATQLRIRLITPQDSCNAASTPNPYDNLPQNPIPQPQQAHDVYAFSHGAARYESRASRIAVSPKSIPQYDEDEKKPSRSSSVIKKILIVLAIFFCPFDCVRRCVGHAQQASSTRYRCRADRGPLVSSRSERYSGAKYWSNAKKLLKSRGADLSNAVVLTDDGSTPVVDANWVVTSAYYNDSGNLEIQLTHKDGLGNASDGPGRYRQLEFQYAGGLEQQGTGVGRQGARAGRYGPEPGRHRAELGRHGDGCLERPAKRHLGRAGKLADERATAARPDARAS